MLLFFLIAVDGALGATDPACIVLGSVSGLGIDMGLHDRHDTDILREVVLAGEVADVVPIDSRLISIALHSFMSYVYELRAGQGSDLTKNLNHASIFGRDRQSGQLLLQFEGDARRPAAHLVIDQTNVLLPLLQTLSLDLQLLILVLQVSILGLLGLHDVLRCPKVSHLLLVGKCGLFVVSWRAFDLPPVLTRH